jgi:hypothetical protein
MSWWSIGWNLVGVFSVGLGAYMVAASEFGGSPDAARASWFVGGLATIGVGVGLFLVIFNGWHLFAQREVALLGEEVKVRRWLDVLRDRPGVAIDTGSLRRARFVVRGGGAKLDLESDELMTFSIWFWPLADARRLAAELEARHIAVKWELPYPSS